MSDSKMNEVPASKFADRMLLDKIDKLKSCGVGDLVELPQLVVVGNQSSGKSSVLEGLTKLPFPRNSDLCTRFTTQITFKRSDFEHISVSIMPGPSASEEHEKHVRSWSPAHLKELTPESFAEILLEAQARMGLSQANDSKINFSEDIFRIEITGPDQEHFSIVDVPGIFMNPEAGRTTKADLDMVKRMVERQMHNDRSVMLTVFAANADTATQGILTMAKEADPKGIRTLGILTKPDLVAKREEQTALDQMNGRRFPLELGWHILRNGGQGDLEDESYDRDATELKFFREVAPWNTVTSENYGIRSLRKKLMDILGRHIKREFPKVRTEIMKRLKIARNDFEGLGVPRSTSHEIRAFLIDISMKFERIANDALHTRYTMAIFDEHKELRLPTAAVNRQDEFANDMTRSGHTYAFKVQVGEGNDPNAKIKPDLAGKMGIRYRAEFPEFTDMVDEQQEVSRYPKTGIISWISSKHTAARGFELGSIDPALLMPVFRSQSENWSMLAKGYVCDMIEKVHKFTVVLLGTLVADEEVKDALLSRLHDDFARKYKRAFEHVEFLLTVEQEIPPTTANHYFNDTLQKVRSQRLQQGLQEATSDFSFPTIEQIQSIRVDDLKKFSENMSNKEHVVQDFHDVLKSYYKVALKRFVDNVIHQAVLYFLIFGPDSPLKLFSASYVSSLSDNELQEIAGEDLRIKEKRESLIKAIATLEEGRKIMQ